MSEIKVPIGPQHPALEEPELFLLTVDGEEIVCRIQELYAGSVSL